MIEWGVYLKQIVNIPAATDNITLSLNGDTLRISPIVKASVLMLEDMMANQGLCNIFVFPEINRSMFEFLISKVVFDVTAGKIQMSYDPEKFQKGQILKYKGCSVEFDGIEKGKDEKTRIFIVFSDGMRYGVPIEIAPFFQISDGKKLSSYKSFKKKYSAEDAKISYENPVLSKTIVDTLENHKTHLDGSVVFVSSIKKAREFLSTALIDYRKISDVLYVAQINGDGEITNLTPGQLSGSPAIVIASDLYSVRNAIGKGLKVKSVIVDVSQTNCVDKQLDAFDSLHRTGLPLICITDTANSFELSSLLERGYNLWRWDSDSITEAVVSSDNRGSDRRVRNCLKHSTEYRCIPESSISDTVQLLCKLRSVIDDQPPKVVDIFEKVFSLAFMMLRYAMPIEGTSRERHTNELITCLLDIEVNKRFMNKEVYDCLVQAVGSLKPVFGGSYINGKHEEIRKTVQDVQNKRKSVCIIIPEKADRLKYQEYWKRYSLSCDIKVMYPMEYRERSDCNFDLVIVVGWLGNRIMRHLIYSFVSRKYIVLTYPCETRWEKAHTKGWKKALNNSSNGEVIKKSFSKGTTQISVSRFEHSEINDDKSSDVDELADIESVIRTSRYKKYGGYSKGAEVVEAYPIGFVGGYLAFYRSGHKALVATNIIVNNGAKIDNKLPEKLAVGDFIVIRESGRDMVRTIADLILERAGKTTLRNTALKWKEALKVETLFSSYEDIYEKLRINGCNKDFATVRNWLVSEDLIQPNDKNDLLCIAKATGDPVLNEKLEEVYNAGKEVRSAHIQAGRVLSKRLKGKIVEYIQNLGITDTFNIWDPISIQIDEIGQVKILKVIDVGVAVPVDAGNTNRLLYE